MDHPHRRKAQNEAVFREVNERIEVLHRQFAMDADEPLQIVCECDRVDCAERIDVSVEQYERVRSEATCFFVVTGHEDDAVEDVVDTGDGCLIVRKHAGEPAQIAEETDPRD
jgi:hypothetical protein